MEQTITEQLTVILNRKKLNKQKKEMDMEDNSIIKVCGQYRCTVKREDGTIEQGEWKNTIHADFLGLLESSLATPQDYALNNLMDTVEYNDEQQGVWPTQAEKDGILLRTDSLAFERGSYTTVCGIADGTPTYSKKVTGVFTGYEVTVHDANLGWNLKSTAADPPFNKTIATPTSWSNITLAVADELTIEWTISFS